MYALVVVVIVVVGMRCVDMRGLLVLLLMVLLLPEILAVMHFGDVVVCSVALLLCVTLSCVDCWCWC